MRNGETVIAEIPMEHLVMYSNYGNGRLGKIMRLTPQCVCCLKVAKHFMLIKEGKSKQRFTLYTEDYEELTIDHIKPKNDGGANSMANYQVMCCFCNRAKGCLDITVEQLRERISRVASGVVYYTSIKPLTI